MGTPAVHHRLPAGVDTISCAETALLTLAMAIQRPLRAETVTCCSTINGAASPSPSPGTHQPDDVLEVVELHAQRRPRRPRRQHHRRQRAPRPQRRATTATDVDRWLEMSDIAEQAGVELLEWFVIGGEVTCPRDQLGEPPRW